jgi:peptidyl-dipeptidase Dcp
MDTTQPSPCPADVAANPLIAPSPHRHEAVPFDAIATEHFLPALDWAIADAKAEIERIATAPEAANFANTIEALELAGQDVERVSGIFHNLLSAETSDALQALTGEIGPRTAAFANDIALDPRIFARVKAVHDRRTAMDWTAEQTQLLDDTYKSFVRNGALLSDDEKGELRAIDEKLSKLCPDFGHNVLKATNDFALVIRDQRDLAGLPESARAAAAEAATARGETGAWAFTLHGPSVQPFLTYADHRGLREEMWRALATRAFGGSFDNQPLVLEIANLRHRRARLLGYATHADFVLEQRMAETPGRVGDFLEKLLAASRPAAERDLAEIQAHALTLGGPEPLMPWDFSYYAEKLKQARFAYDDEALRPYFPLARVVEGVFEHCRLLYGLIFRRADGYPVWHPEVTVYEVEDERDGSFVGLFYTDFFPRPTKQNGAWMTTFRDQGTYRGGVKRPHVAIVCNFTRPSGDKPSLLTFDEVSTLFHEMGHALHGLLSRCTYRSLGGTNVRWDFVELPSQIFENWLREKESLDIFARHWQTGEPMPADLVEKIRASARFLAGYSSLRQVQFGLLDMAWHGADPSAVASVPDFEKAATERATVLPRVPGTNSSVAFSHIFGGGYSAGYYSYKWAEVLDADAFEAFKEKGLFDRATADSFRRHILERGGTEPPMDLYKRFRGREPDPDAMLRRDGLI